MKKIALFGIVGLMILNLCGCVTTKAKAAPESIETVSIKISPAPIVKPVHQVPVVAKVHCVSPAVPEKTCPLADMNNTILKYLILLLVLLFVGLGWYYRAGKRLVHQKKIKVTKHAKKKISNLKDLLGK
jgi:hypothetical protein